jgi:subtilisin family serine protease
MGQANPGTTTHQRRQDGTVQTMASSQQNPWLAETAFVIGGLAAALVARRVVNVVWVAASGKPVPTDPGDPRVSTGEAVAFAMATGALVGVARLLVQRKANEIKARRSGSPV